MISYKSQPRFSGDPFWQAAQSCGPHGLAFQFPDYIYALGSAWRLLPMPERPWYPESDTRRPAGGRPRLTQRQAPGRPIKQGKK